MGIKIFLSIFLVLSVIYLVPFLVYGIFSAVIGLKPPEGASPLTFLLSVLVSKIGTAMAFVLIFYVGRESLSDQWLWYAFLWWVMYLFGEIGQAIGPDYSWEEAAAGALSETVYFPLSAYIVSWLIK